MLDSLVLALSFVVAVPLVAAMVDWLVGERLVKEGLTDDLDRRTGSPQGTASST
jgi:hypothetical protein